MEAGQPVFSLKFIKGVKYVHVILLKQTKKKHKHNIKLTLMAKKLRPLSLARALAIMVLEQPGGP